MDREKIKKAKQQLEEPSLRIRSELFWPSADFAHFTECQKSLRAGHYTEFVTYCEHAISKELVFPPDILVSKENLSLSFPDEKAVQAEARLRIRIAVSLARHHLAVFYHSSAIAIARKAARSIPGANLPPANWDHAYQHWLVVQEDDFFWQYLASRARMLGDARLKPEHLFDLRRELLASLLNINVAIGHEALERGELTELHFQANLIKASPFGRNRVAGACEALAAPLLAKFEGSLKEIQPKLTDRAINAFTATLPKPSPDADFYGRQLKHYLAEVERSINKRILPLANRVKEANLQDTATGIEILDGTAHLLRALCLALNNHAGLPGEALRVVVTAQKHAASQECKKNLLEDHRTLSFLSLQQEAVELAKARRFRESLARLDQALQFASSSEERRTIEQWQVEAKKLIAYEGVEPIERAPSLYRVNGIGTMLYGRRDFDPTTNSYVATLYFTFLLIPIFPIAAYRVIDEGGGAYRFLGKVPLSRAAFAVPGTLGALFLFAVLSSNLSNTSSQYGSNPPASPPFTNTPPLPEGKVQSPKGNSATGRLQPGPQIFRDSEKARLRIWIEQEAPRLKREKEELGRIEVELDLEKTRLDQEYNDLSYRRPLQYEVDSYEEARQRYNGRVASFNARIGKFNSDVAKLREQARLYELIP